MKLVAINGSARAASGNTHRLIGPFLEGAREAGAETDLIELAAAKIHPCSGDLSCWLRTPGRCIWDGDDMAALRARVAAADVLVVATPVYVDGPTGQIKVFFDRLLPLFLPFFELREGHLRHPRREAVRITRTALIATCGLYELDNFEPVLAWVRGMCHNLGTEFAGALLRPHAPALEGLERSGKAPADVYAAVREAGRQVVRDGAFRPETLAAVARELMPLRAYLWGANRFFRSELEKAGRDG